MRKNTPKRSCSILPKWKKGVKTAAHMYHPSHREYPPRASHHQSYWYCWQLATNSWPGRGPAGLQAQVWNWGRLENRSRVVPGLPGVTRWRRLNWDIHSQSYHFGLVYDVIYQFIGMEAKNYKFGMFCQQCHRIHPWPQVMLIFDQERPPGFTPAICLRCNFVYISILENLGDKSVN